MESFMPREGFATPVTMPYSLQPQVSMFPTPLDMPTPTGNGGVQLRIMQQPQHAKVAGVKDKDCKPIDPPPILKLVVDERSYDRNFYGRLEAFLQNPFLFVTCELINDPPNGDDRQNVDCSKALIGNKASSLQRIKLPSGEEAGFFAFGNLSVKNEGFYKLEFSLCELRNNEVWTLTSIESERFQVHTQRTFPGMRESTELTRIFHESGCRLRVRKESRTAENRRRTAQQGAAMNKKRNFDTYRAAPARHETQSNESSPQLPEPKRTRQEVFPEADNSAFVYGYPDRERCWIVRPSSTHGALPQHHLSACWEDANVVARLEETTTEYDFKRDALGVGADADRLWQQWGHGAVSRP